MITQSASQLSEVLECVRFAALKRIDKIVSLTEDTFSRDLGTRIHQITCAYVRNGTEPDLYETMSRRVQNPRTGELAVKTFYPGQIASAAFPLLRPNAGPTWFTETSIKGLTLPNGIPLQGDIDLAIADGDVLEIRDYKSTSDFKWAKTEADLRSDIQANIYAYAGFSAIDRGVFPNVYKDVIDLHWQYLRTTRPASHSVRFRISREENLAFIHRLAGNAGTWVELRKKKVSGTQLPPIGLATGKCSKHNGCPYRGTTCVITVEDALRYQEGMDMNDLSALLAQRTQSQQALSQVPPPASLAPAPGGNPFLAPPPAAPARPSYWMPGDALNEFQEMARDKGKPLSFIANMADNPPPPEVSASYDRPALSAPASWSAPPVEAGQINPPESAGMPAFATVEQLAMAFPPAVQAPATVTPAAVDAFGEGSDFAALKAECDRLGLNPEGKRLKTSGYKKLLDEYRAKPSPLHHLDNKGMAPAPAPVQVPAPPACLPVTVVTDLSITNGQLSDADVERIANAVVARLADALARLSR